MGDLDSIILHLQESLEMVNFKEPNDTILVTRPTLPELADVLAVLEHLWKSKRLTNSGALERLFEERLLSELGVIHVSFVTNGSLALQIACTALELEGQVITTPFTFPATINALYWNGLEPIFCDVEPERFTIDPGQIEALITPETTAILGVHLFGNPCEIVAIQDIARKHKLAIIYDSSHAFGVCAYEKPIAYFGDVSAFSFHATKLFHTFEGGALTFKNARQYEKCVIMKNHGIDSAGKFVFPGTNAKANEFQALIGLLLLQYTADEVANRRKCTELYHELLSDVEGLRLINVEQHVKHNYSYFPIEINQAIYKNGRDRLAKELKAANIQVKPYFSYLCSHIPLYKGLPSANPDRLPVAEKAAQQVLCFPLHSSLSLSSVERIGLEVKRILGSQRRINLE